MRCCAKCTYDEKIIKLLLDIIHDKKLLSELLLQAHIPTLYNKSWDQCTVGYTKVNKCRILMNISLH